MSDMISGMINNIFLIIFPIVLYQVFATAGRRNFFSRNRIILTVLFSVSIVLCMLFPFSVLTDDYIFDLRQVPMIVGALYGGPVVSFVLFSVSFLTRLLLGGDGVSIAVLNQLLLAVIVPLLRPAYMRLKWPAKVGFVFMISTSSIMFNLIAGSLLFGDPIHDLFTIWLMMLINQGIISALAALLIERVQRQEYLMDSIMKHEKLETVSHFAASVSHELRNPLQSIKGFIQLMQMHEYDRDKQLAFHETILREIESAERLIDDYLVFAKPTYGQMEAVSVRQEIVHIIQLMTPYAMRHDVEILLTDPAMDGYIKADRQKLRQALINLMRNGIEAMPQGGRYFITIRQAGARVRLELTDEGIGMTKEEIRRLGEPYFSTKTKGTGLGMMVTYSIIRQLHGIIEVDSEKNRGTTFTLAFPAVNAPKNP